MSEGDGYVVISIVQGQFVEAQIKAFLEAHGIPCQLRGEALRVTHAISVDGIGAAEVLVPADRADEARDLLARADRGELAIDDPPAEPPRRVLTATDERVRPAHPPDPAPPLAFLARSSPSLVIIHRWSLGTRTAVVAVAAHGHPSSCWWATC